MVLAASAETYFEHIWKECDSKFEIVAINDLADTATNAHLLKYDSVHGTPDYDISSSEGSISVGNQTFKCFRKKRNPEDLPERFRRRRCF